MKTSLETMTLEDDIARVVRRRVRPRPRIRWCSVVAFVLAFVVFNYAIDWPIVRATTDCWLNGERPGIIACYVKADITREFELCRHYGGGCGNVSAPKL